jgi:hypothetical protein
MSIKRFQKASRALRAPYYRLLEPRVKKILIILAVIFAIIYSTLAFSAGAIFNSPDENANYFFSRLFATENRLDYSLPEKSDILHPRSMTVVGQRIVPQSFLGLPLIYGILAKFYTAKAILFFTPIIAVISVLFFYEIIKKVFGEKVAFLTALIIFIHPAFWYYATHTMYHNVLFLALFMVGICFLLVDGIGSRTSKKEVGLPMRNAILSSIFISLALVVRYSEAPWVLLALVILYLSNRKDISWNKILISLMTLTAVLLPILFLNNKLYGSPLISGYNLADSNLVDVAELGTMMGSNWLGNIFSNFWNYGIYLFWWLCLPALFGLIWLLKRYKKLNKKQRLYLIVFLASSAYLIIYYGSWVFHDNPDPTKITIGTSYVRYWLPIYVFSAPFLATTLLKIKKLVAKLDYKYKILALILFLIVVSYNFLFTFKLAEESIANNVLQDYKIIKDKVLQLTEPNAIIVAGYYDKLFFPDRLVIENIDEERNKRLQEIKRLLGRGYPIYLYSWYNDADIKYLNSKILKEYDLSLTEGKEISEGERLYQVKSSN